MKIKADVYWGEPIGEAIASEFGIDDDFSSSIARIEEMERIDHIRDGLYAAFEYEEFDRNAPPDTVEKIKHVITEWWNSGDKPATQSVTAAIAELADAVFALDGVRIRAASEGMWKAGGYAKNEDGYWSRG